MTNVLLELLALVDNSVNYEHEKIKIIDQDIFQAKIARWVEVSTLETGLRQGWARFLVRKAAQELGIFPASINDLYMARGREEILPTFTVPAINLRVLSYDAARAAFCAAISINASAIIFEIARSEMGYTAQRPAEFSTNILAAAIAENYRGPVFIQGDHFQVSAKRFGVDPEAELKTIKELIQEAINAGFYNIDIDTSTLVDVSIDDISQQQKKNIELSVYFSNFIRKSQPEGVTISIGGEIGEVGGKNSTSEELISYLNGFNETSVSQKLKFPGLSKVSIQTGTSHGGIVLPDGTIAEVKVDFETLRELSRVSRSDFGLGGTVQHGASTLPEEAFGKFVEYEAIEVHLATNFMNMFYDQLPEDMRLKIYSYLDEKYSGDRKPGMTEEQFYYKIRKNAIGPFKEEIYKLPTEFHEKMKTVWQEKFYDLFRLLGLEDTKFLVDKYIPAVSVEFQVEDFLGKEYKKEDVSDLAD
jgi:fructose/tagatose bisphosphate aldolase